MTLLGPLIAGPARRSSAIPCPGELCRRIGWFKPAGDLKDLMAWVPMLTDRPATARPNEYLGVGGRSELPVHRHLDRPRGFLLKKRDVMRGLPHIDQQ